MDTIIESDKQAMIDYLNENSDKDYAINLCNYAAIYKESKEAG